MAIKNSESQAQRTKKSRLGGRMSSAKGEMSRHCGAVWRKGEMI
jgi:hypothetical protein